jgi:hypothetical protein
MDHESKMLAVDREIQRLEAELHSIQASMFSSAKSEADKTTDTDHFNAGISPSLTNAGWTITITDAPALLGYLKAPEGVKDWLFGSTPQPIAAWTIARTGTRRHILLYYQKDNVKVAVIDPDTMSNDKFKELPTAGLWSTKGRPRPGADYTIYIDEIQKMLPTQTPQPPLLPTQTPPPPLR